MKVVSILALGASLSFLGVEALRVEKRDTPAVLSLPLQKRTPGPSSKRSLRKRQGEVQTPDINYNTQLLYLVELQIGTPPQSTYVQLDTGSSDLVVETPTSDICSAAPPNPCTNYGSYFANSSSTYQYIDSNFQVAYGGGDGATGDWGADTYSIGGAVLQGAQFGVMYKSTILEGILGVSYPIIEGRNTFSGEPLYDNLPILLVKQGYIASRAFSLWTNDDSASAGTLLFGGIDTGKFIGQLVTIDLLASGFDGFPGVVDFTISLQGVTGTKGGAPVTFPSGGNPMNVLMDSGTTVTQLPSALVLEIWAAVGATPYSNDPNSASIPCNPSATDSINFEFNGITIVVPLTQLAIFPDGFGNCQFGISIGTENIIGDSVLAAMYVVYDLDNNQISLAPTNYNSATTNILQIVAGPGGVPDTGSSSSSSSQSSTSSSTSSSSSSTSSTVSTTSTSSSFSSSSGSSSSSSATPTTKPKKCQMDNCLRAVAKPTVSLFCASYTANLPVAIPTNVASGCKSLPSRISSACSCYNTASVSLPPSSSSTSSTLTTTTTFVTVPGPSAVTTCKKNNCLRAVQGGGPSATAFCSDLFGSGILPTPTAINKACSALPSKVESACSCAVPSSGGVKKKVVIA